jgi:hypothetical protein
MRQAVARVMGPTGEPVGGAFLVAPNVLLTAAHVVSLAAGSGKDAIERPDGVVLLSFAVAPDRLVRAELVHWVPPGTASPEDVAGLRLIDPAPAGIVPAPMVDLLAPLGHRVVTLGFPRDAPHGGWGHGQLAGSDARDLVQIDTLPDSQFTIEAGFSGTPVWDLEDGAAAGLVVEGWTRGRRSGFMIPTSVLLAAWPWLADQVRPVSPFRGLKSFSEHDSAVFFGRDELVDQLVGLTEHAPVVTVVGSSGVGKSSVLHAGVVPRLRRRAGLVVATMRPSQARTPLRAVAQALVRVAEPEADPLTRGTRVDEFAERLARGLVTEVVGDVLDKCGGERLVLVADQLEEALIASADELTQFASVLGHCLRPSSRLVLLTALRLDFLSRAFQPGALGELMQGGRIVHGDELSESDLRAAIVEPVRRTRMVRYEAGLVDRLLTDVGTAAGRLPLLQFTLAMLWEDQDSGVLTHRAYDALGGVESALAQHAEAVWNGLGTDERTAASRMLVQLLYPLSDQAGFVRRAAPRDQLDDAQWDAAQRLAADRARLVVVREQDSSEVVELAHDALVTHWHRLGELGEQDREFREWQEGVRHRIRRDAPPLAGADLREALKWRAGRSADLAEGERTYLEASRRKRNSRLRKWAAAVVVAALFGGLLLVQREQRVASDAANNLIHNIDLRDPYARLRMTLRAYQTSANDVTKPQVTTEYNRYAGTDRLVPDYTARPILLPGRDPIPVEPPSAMAHKVSADGRTLVTTDPQDNVTLWRIDGGTVTGRALGQPAIRVTISRDGRYVAYLQKPNIRFGPNAGPRGSCAGVCLFDTMTEQTRQLGTVDAGLTTPVIRFDPTGHLLAVAYSPDTVIQRLAFWDVATGRRRDDITVPGGELDTVHDMWLSPGGRQVLLDVTKPTHPGSRVLESVLASVDLTGPSPEATQLTDGFDSQQVAMSADGARLAVLLPVGPPTSTLDEHPHSRLVVLDIATLDKLAEVPALSERQSLGTISLDPHGDKVFLTDDAAVSIWQVGQPAAPPAMLHTPTVWRNVLPLGSGEDTPLLLVNSDVIGLALPETGRPAPMRRFASAPRDETGLTERTDPLYDELISMLASGVPLPSELTDLPAGAYTGPLGG